MLFVFAIHYPNRQRISLGLKEGARGYLKPDETFPSQLVPRGEERCPNTSGVTGRNCDHLKNYENQDDGIPALCQRSSASRGQARPMGNSSQRPLNGLTLSSWRSRNEKVVTAKRCSPKAHLKVFVNKLIAPNKCCNGNLYVKPIHDHQTVCLVNTLLLVFVIILFLLLFVLLFAFLFSFV